MRVYSDREPDEKPDAMNKMMQATQDSYRSFNDYVAFRKDDPIWMLIYKIILRFFGILFMLALSPFLILGLIVAFAAVM